MFEHHVPSNAVVRNSTYWIEVIAYNPTLDVEAPHLYIPSDVLCARFTEKARNSSGGNLLFAYSETVVPGEKLAQNLYLKYIFNRIAIKGEDGDEGATEEERNAKVSGFFLTVAPAACLFSLLTSQLNTSPLPTNKFPN